MRRNNRNTQAQTNIYNWVCFISCDIMGSQKHDHGSMQLLSYNMAMGPMRGETFGIVSPGESHLFI